MIIPAGLDRAGLEHVRDRVEQLMNCLTVEAEAWAAAGTRKSGELIIHPEPAPPPQLLHESRSHTSTRQRPLAA
jgi:hypothetical protein